MGAGNKLNANAFRVADISQTTVCPLAKVMRRELKKRGIEGVKVCILKNRRTAETKAESGKELSAVRLS